MKYIHIEIVEAEPEIANHSTEKIKEGEEGMLVTCKSGYKHFVPKKVFDRRYLPIIPNPKLTKSDVSVSQDMVDRFISDVDPTTLRGKTTLVRCRLVNSFEINETSTCVDKSNYDQSVGCPVCMERIGNKIWEYLGFLLATAAHGFERPMMSPEVSEIEE